MAGKRNNILNDVQPTAKVTPGKRLSLSAPVKATAKNRKLVVDLMRQTENLTQKDLRDWRGAWQMAINVEYPNRLPLYNIYTDVDADLQVTGAIGQRKNMVKRKSFKIVDRKGIENKDLTEMFERPWFKCLLDEALNSPYWGHSLIELGDVIYIDDVPAYSYAKLVPRQHVKPEFGVIVKNPYDDSRTGYDYRSSDMAQWLIECGTERDLGLFLKLAHQTIPKKNMLAFWDQFGELFGMPLRIAKTTSRDEKEHAKSEKMLQNMGAAGWGLFPEGFDIEIKETTRGDAFNVYDKRIDKADSYISKGILNQTMTIDNGSSMSQSKVHLEIFQQVVDADADMVRDMINFQLLPRMLAHGFPVSGYRFYWNESIDYTPEQQVGYERMLIENYEVDPKYFEDKYNVPILGVKQKPVQTEPKQQLKNFFD